MIEDSIEKNSVILTSHICFEVGPVFSVTQKHRDPASIMNCKKDRKTCILFMLRLTSYNYVNGTIFRGMWHLEISGL